ncbi:hypothetical protein Vretimale_13970 [Volvox reticuliferus]|uniref:Uncharacterized protein n=1 Tax=Volvox reticuliferus TaxID=1737510 RepID=A0A8J4GMR5_9CHLO|nr:hypothetical protein Vretifemale_16141 [Volvox reticuliferus]GIM10223.1 hypothetical protein Vretimale_13970 [Volvox reticuliferus]
MDIMAVEDNDASPTTDVSPGCGRLSSSMQVPDDLKIFWQALLALDFPVGSFLNLPSGVYLLGKKCWGSALLVRHCYRGLFDRMMDLHSSSECRFLITGTPGIGKSFFAVVLMGWLAKEKKVSTIVFDTSGVRYLFTFNNGMSVGVAVGHRKDFTEKLMNSATWWIIDTGTALERGANTVLLSSPNRELYKEFLKLQGSNVLYMPIWTDDEIEKCRSQVFPTIDLGLVRALRSRWGNIPRYVLEKAANVSAQHSLDDAISACNWEDMVTCIADPGVAKDVSHKLVHIKVKDDQYDQMITKVASSYVVQKMEAKAGYELVQELQNLIHQSTWAPKIFSAAAGDFFESYTHHCLQHGGFFKVRHLCSSLIEETQQETELMLHLSPEIHEFRKVEDLQQQGIRAYYVSCIDTFPSMDAKLQQPDLLILITIVQMSVVDLIRITAAARRQLSGPKQRLYFSVPSCMFESFKFVDISRDIEQWVLEVPWM